MLARALAGIPLIRMKELVITQFIKNPPLTLSDCPVIFFA